MGDGGGALESAATDAARSVTNFSTGLRADVEAHLTASDAATDARLRQIEVDTGSRLTAIESAVQLFDCWRPRVDSSLDAMKTNLDRLCSEASRMEVVGFQGVFGGFPGVLGSPGSGATSSGLLGSPPSFAPTGAVPVRPSATVDHSDAYRFGPSYENYLRDSGLRYPDCRWPLPGHGYVASPVSTIFLSIARSFCRK